MFTNNKGITFNVGDRVFYVMIEDLSKFKIKTIIVRYFIVLKNRVCVKTRDIGNLIDINNLYKNKTECEEAIKEWQKTNITMEILKELNYLNKKKKK